MAARRLVVMTAAAALSAGQIEIPLRIECACPITVEGSSAGISWKSRGAVRTSTKAGLDWIFAAGPDLTVSVGVRPVAIVSRGGDIEVRRFTGRLRAEPGGGRVTLDAVTGDIVLKGAGEVKAGRFSGALQSVQGSGGVSVRSAGGDVFCETAGGEIIVENSGGAVTATTGGGNIYIRNAAGPVTAHSDGGLIDVQYSGGMVTAETHGGSIQVGSAGGARCESSAGAIRVRTRGRGLRAQTAMGSIVAEFLPGAPVLEDSSVVSGSGDITVLLPSNLSVSVQAVSESRGRLARIISDFPEIHLTGLEAWPVRTVAAQGVLNGGGRMLQVTGAGGTIYLRRTR